MKDHERLPIIPIRKGNGIFLEDFDGNRYIDAVSSWWVNLFGHCNPRINDAIKRQIDTLEHVILGGFSHEAIIRLSEQLVAITPPGLSKCFYADNGSSAIEVALKMSFHYWRNLGQNKKLKFINLSNSYHGETLAALAVGDVALYKETYEPLLMQPITVPSPDCYYREEGESWEDYSLRQFEKMETTLQKHAHEVAAVIVEPLIQCAGNMRMYHPIYLQRLRAACDKYGVHLIADEIAVGFGRTGTLFACEQAGISPDFMCLSKGLSGGYLPISAVLTHENVYQAFYDDYETLRGFLHSHSFTGNPVGCAAALATIDIFKTDNVIENNRALSQHMHEVCQRFNDHPHVSEVRQHGMVLAIEMIKNKKTKEEYDWKERRGLKVYEYAITQGALLRPLGNVTYFMPPYIITKQQIEQLADIAWQGINLATKD
jgi:adenosylmethionine-8-amino-7-oxononanoate aminotransferase